MICPTKIVALFLLFAFAALALNAFALASVKKLAHVDGVAECDRQMRRQQ